MTNLFARFLHDQSGATAIEYGLIPQSKETAPAGAELRPSYLECTGGGPAQFMMWTCNPPMPLNSILEAKSDLY